MDPVRHMQRFAFFVALSGMVFGSCVKEQQEVLPVFADTPVFHAAMENPDGGETRVFANELHQVRWDAGDRICIFNKNTSNLEYLFQGQTGDGYGEFNPVPGAGPSAGNPLDRVYAVYPYAASTSMDGEGVITCSLPSEQTYREKSFGIGANTMVAAAEGDGLLFKNLCGYFAVCLYGEDMAVKRVSIRGNHNEPLAGWASVTASSDASPALQFNASTAKHEIELTCPEPVTLGTTAETATEFWFVIPPTTFAGGITVTILDDRGCIFERVAFDALEIRRNTLKLSEALQVVPLPEPEPIDLGLSVLWGSFNLGAGSPDESGNYYAWGEIAPKPRRFFDLTLGKWYGSYDWSDYKWCNGTGNTLLKYNTLSEYGIVDNKTMLEFEDDAARMNLGKTWCLPTMKEILELYADCTREWTIVNDAVGIRFTSTKEGYTDKSIFVPAAGYLLYGRQSDIDVCCFRIADEENKVDPRDFGCIAFPRDEDIYPVIYRCNGCPVRPVFLPVPVSSLRLSAASLTLYADSYRHLELTVLPENASRKEEVIWTSSNESVATVDGAGNVKAVAPGRATIYAGIHNGIGTADSCKITVSAADLPIPEAIELGLSVKWASFNLGASAPEDYGRYYAWGETVPKDIYTWSNYKWCNGSEYSLTKYNFDSEYGLVDNRLELEEEDDAVRANLGGGWRMPCQEEFKELVDNCTAERIIVNGVSGYRFTSLRPGFKDKSIFLPEGGSSFILEGLNGAGDGGRYLSFSLYHEWDKGRLIVFEFPCGLEVSPALPSPVVGTSGRSAGNLIRPVIR